MFHHRWFQRWNTVRRVLVENLGFRRWTDVASWGVAFSVAYWLWIRPGQKEKAEIEVF